MDPIYLNAYLPKQQPLKLALPTCGACAAHLRIALLRGAIELEDRMPLENGGSNDEEVW